MLVDRRAVVFLAAHSRAAVRARLFGGARGRASRGAESLAPLLAPAAAVVSGNATRQGVAQRARRRPAPLRRASAGGLAPAEQAIEQPTVDARLRRQALIAHRRRRRGWAAGRN